MRNYVVTAAAVNFPAGSVLALDKDQHRRRQHSVVDPGKTDLADLPIDSRVLKSRELTLAVARAPLCFKHGETVSVVHAPGVNFDRLSEMAEEGSEAAQDAVRDTRSRRAEAEDKASAARRPAMEKAEKEAKPAAAAKPGTAAGPAGEGLGV